MLTGDIIFAAALLVVCGLSLAEVCDHGAYNFNNKCYEPFFQRRATFETANLVCNDKNGKLAVSNDQTHEFLNGIAVNTTREDNFWVGDFQDCYAIKHANLFEPEYEDCGQYFFYFCEFEFCQWQIIAASWNFGDKCLELSVKREKYEEAKESCSRWGGKLAEIDDETRLFILWDINVWVMVETSTLKDINSNEQVFWAAFSGKYSKRWVDSQGEIVSLYDNINSDDGITIEKDYCEINSNCDVINFFFCEYEMQSSPNDIGPDYHMKSENIKPEMDKPESDEHEMDKPESDEHEMDKPESDEHEMGNPGTDKSESYDSGKMKPQEYVIIGILSLLSILIVVVIVQLTKLSRRNALAMVNKITRDKGASFGYPTEETNLIINGSDTD